MFCTMEHVDMPAEGSKDIARDNYPSLNDNQFLLRHLRWIFEFLSLPSSPFVIHGIRCNDLQHIPP